MEFLYRHTGNGMLQKFHSSFLLEKIGARSLHKERTDCDGKKNFAKTWTSLRQRNVMQRRFLVEQL